LRALAGPVGTHQYEVELGHEAERLSRLLSGWTVDSAAASPPRSGQTGLSLSTVDCRLSYFKKPS
jgi:hypothetical protein